MPGEKVGNGGGGSDRAHGVGVGVCGGYSGSNSSGRARQQHAACSMQHAAATQRIAPAAHGDSVYVI
jgi:hypothetical protein